MQNKRSSERESKQEQGKYIVRGELHTHRARYVCMLLRYGQTYDIGIQYIIGVLVLVLGVCFIKSFLSTPLKLTSSHDTENRYTTHRDTDTYTYTQSVYSIYLPYIHTYYMYVYMYTHATSKNKLIYINYIFLLDIMAHQFKMGIPNCQWLTHINTYIHTS